MDQQIDDYINDFAKDALSAEIFSSKSEEEKSQLQDKLKQHLYSVVLNTLVDNLDMEQLAAFNALDPDSNEAPEMIQKLASEVPNFLNLVDTALKAEVGKIKNSGNIPAEETSQSEPPKESNPW